VSNERAKGGSNVTLRDVARKAAVHPGTVSRALNVETRALVNEETAQRVIDAAEELGYQPNPIARGLKTNRSYTVGVLIPDLTNPLFPGVIGFPIGGWLSDVAVRRGIGRKRLVVIFTALQCALTVAFGLVITGGAPSVWLMAALLFGASTFFNAMQPIAQAMIADIADPAHHGAAFGMNNLIGETGAVLSPAVSGVLRDATGAWSAAVFLDAGLIACAVVLFLFVRESAKSQVLGRRDARDRESRLGPRLQPSQRTTVYGTHPRALRRASARATQEHLQQARDGLSGLSHLRSGAWTPSRSTKPRPSSHVSSRAPRRVRRSSCVAGRRPWPRSSPTTRRRPRGCPAP
jgi:hypothetical protein